MDVSRSSRDFTGLQLHYPHRPTDEPVSSNTKIRGGASRLALQGLL